MECFDSGTYLLYSTPHSLYAGRARACLIKRCIPFEERSVGHSSFTEIKPIGKLPTMDEAALDLKWVLDNAGSLISGAVIDLSGGNIP